MSHVTEIHSIKDIKQYQKPHDSIFAKLIIRRLSRMVTFYLIRISWMTPNVISTLALVMGLGASLLFLASNYWWRVLGVLLLQIALVFDCCDGEVARVRELRSPFGAWLDSVYDRFKEAAMLFGMMYFYYLQTNQIGVLFVGFSAIIGMQIMSFLREAKKSSWPQQRTAELYILPTVYIGSVDVIIWVVSFAVLFGLEYYALWFFLIISVPLILKQISSAYRLHKKT